MTDSPQPPDSHAEPAPRKPLTSGWIFPVGGGLLGAYFLIKGAFAVRETHGDVIFALLMTGIVVVLAVLGTAVFRTYRADRERPEK